MIRRIASAVTMTFVATLTLGGQGAADAHAASTRLIIPKTGTNAVVKKVPVKHGELMIGHELQGVVYTAKNGDPPCDPMGRTMYVGHAWRAGNGTADRWVTLKKGDRLRVGGCAFRVVKKLRWKDTRSLRSLSRPDGPPEVALVACWATDYDDNVIIIARKVGSRKMK